MFEKIIGNEKIKQTFIDALSSGNISHSYLFVGKPGIGKRLFAKEIAKKVMCIGNENCESCQKFDTNSNPDFQIIEPDGKSIKIEQIRNMQSRILEKPIISNKKVYIIDNSDLMSEESQNCLLKTLEEPPEYAMIILIASNETRIIQTIKSRCIIVKFEDLTDEEISKYLNISDSDIIKLCDGSLEKADAIQEKKDIYYKLRDISNTLEQGSLINALNNSELLYNSKDDIMELLDYLNVIFFDKCKENIDYSKAVSIVEKTKKKIIANNNFDMSIDYMLIHIWEEFNGKSCRS